MTPRYFSARLVRGGPAIAVKVVLCGPIRDGEEQDRSPRLQALVDTERDGRLVRQTAAAGEPVEVDGVTLRQVRPIGEDEYRYLLAHAGWAQDHAPEHPKATPREAVAWADLKPIF